MKLKVFIVLIAFFSLIFSVWLMTGTFSYDSKEHAMKIAGKCWSDFGAHIPLIRSFSMGDNGTRLIHLKAPQSPLFPGEPIRYHFLFYALSGLLEKIGVRIDWAMNIPSIIGFTILCVGIVAVAYVLFKNKSVALLSLIFFLLNGSLSFFKFFHKYPLSTSSLHDIITAPHFSSFGPWDGGPVTAFWTLNIFTNQRHLAISFALALFAIFMALRLPKPIRWKQAVLTGIIFSIIVGLLLFTNQAAALCLVIWLFWFFVVVPQTRLPLIVAAIGTLPSLALLTTLTHSSGTIAWDLGYLVAHPLTLQAIASFWFYNLGFHIFFIPLGCLLLPKKAKLLLIPPLLITCIIPNLIRFSPDMINNHKLFNFAMLFGAMISAYTIVYLYQKIKDTSSHWIIRVLNVFLMGFMCLSLTLSGIIDFFPIYNDTSIFLPDESNEDIVYFQKNTPPEAIILNSTWFMHPATIAGRKIFSGYPYFTWSYGYDKETREQILLSIYRATDKTTACSLLIKNNISFVELSDRPEDFIQPNRPLFYFTFSQSYRNDKTGITVFDVGKSCQ